MSSTTNANSDHSIDDASSNSDDAVTVLAAKLDKRRMNLFRIMLQMKHYLAPYVQHLSTTWVRYVIREMNVTVVFTKSGQLPDTGNDTLLDMSNSSEDDIEAFVDATCVNHVFPFTSENRLTVIVPVGPENEVTDYMRTSVMEFIGILSDYCLESNL